MRRVIFSVVCALFVSLTVNAQQKVYTADDFGRLVRQNQVVVAGGIEAVKEGDEVKGGIIKVKEILKNGLKGTKLKKGGVLQIDPTEQNLFWAKAIIQRPEGAESVWILKAEKDGGKVGPVEIIAHFLLDSASVADMAGDNVAPVEQWGTGEEIKDSWGVVKVFAATYYTGKGKRLGTLKYGTCLDIQKITDSKAGEMAVCKKENDSNAFIVNTEDLNVMPGKLSTVDPQRKALRIEEGKIQANIEFLRDKALSSNPYTRDYNRQKSAYNQYWAKVKDLEVKQNKTTGVTRERHHNELRKLKGQDIQIGKSFEAAKKKYNSWLTQHPRESISSPDIKKLQKKLADIQSQL